MITNLFFLRHAESDISIREDRIRPLTQKGIESSKKLPEILKTSNSNLIVPIWIYVFVISILAISGISNNLPGFKIFPFLMTGTLCLYLSDSLLAYDKSVSNFKGSQIYIHLLYYLGQGLIAFGICFF